MFASLGVDSLSKDALLLLEVLELLGQLFVLGHVFFGLLNTDTIVLSNSVQLGQSIS